MLSRDWRERLPESAILGKQKVVAINPCYEEKSLHFLTYLIKLADIICLTPTESNIETVNSILQLVTIRNSLIGGSPIRIDLDLRAPLSDVTAEKLFPFGLEKSTHIRRISRKAIFAGQLLQRLQYSERVGIDMSFQN